MFEELIKTFHCIRIRKTNPKAVNLPGVIEYEIYDDIDDCKSRIKELEKTEQFLEHGYNLKKCFRRPIFGDTEAGDPEKRDSIKNGKKERQRNESIKNDNVSVHKSKAKETPIPEDAVHRPLRSHASIVSLPAAGFVPFEPKNFDPRSYIMPNGAHLSAQCAGAFGKYKGEDRIKLFANIEYFEKTYKPTHRNPEAYLQSCIKQNYAAKEMDKYRNWMYSSLVIQDNNLKDFTVMKTIVKKNGRGGDSLSLTLPSHTFTDAFHSFIGIEKPYEARI